MDRPKRPAPGRRPRLRALFGAVFFSGRPKTSVEGGIEELDEFRPRRRSSSATRAINRSFAAASSAACASAASTCRWSSPITTRRSSRDADSTADNDVVHDSKR
jgi:hypothetical protein